MNEGMNHFTDTLRIKLDKMENQLDGIKSDIRIGKNEDKETIQTKLKEAKQGVQTMKKEIVAAETKAKNWIKAKEKSGASVIKGWISKFDKDKLDRHAKTAEENAVAAVSLAEGKVADAVLATYEALDARMIANETLASKH